MCTPLQITGSAHYFYYLALAFYVRTVGIKAKFSCCSALNCTMILWSVYICADTPPPEQASSDSEEVELQIRPHPNDPSMEGEAIRTLVTSKLCTVAHLVKYLAISSHLDSDTPKSE